MDGCRSGRLVYGKLKAIFEAGNIENALGYERDIAQNKVMSLLGEQIVQYQEVADARRCYCLDACEVNYYVAAGILADNLIDLSKLLGNLKLFGGQLDDYEILRGMMDSHFDPLCLDRANSYTFNSGIGIHGGLIEQKDWAPSHIFRDEIRFCLGVPAIFAGFERSDEWSG